MFKKKRRVGNPPSGLLLYDILEKYLQFVTSFSTNLRASSRVSNIFFQKLLFANSPNRYEKAKKSPSPIVPYFSPKNKKLWPHKDNSTKNFHSWRTWLANISSLQVRLPVIQGTRGLKIWGKRKRTMREFCFTSCAGDAPWQLESVQEEVATGAIHGV